MATTKTTDNPFSNVLEFYINLADEMAPKMKKGIEDWFAFYSKLWEQGIKLQQEWMSQWMGKNNDASAVATGVKDFGDKIMASQKKASTDMINSAVEGVKSFRKNTGSKAKKSR
jgi:hypothetical protein